MRISVIPGDVGYRQDARLCIVTLDGDVVRDVIMANDENGIVVTVKRDESGRIIHHQGDTVSVIRSGKVKIEVPPKREEAMGEVPFT